MDMDTIRSQLGLFEFHHGEENIPSALDGQIIKKVQKSNTSWWLVRDRNNPSFVNFAQKHMTDGQAVQEVSLQTLFLFLTSGQVSPQQENIPGP